MEDFQEQKEGLDQLEQLDQITEFDHVSPENMEGLGLDPYGNQIIKQENFLGIPYFAFQDIHQLGWIFIKNEEKDQDQIEKGSKYLLLLNGEVGTAWTARKQLLDSNYFNSNKKLDQELHFNELILTKFKKASQGFHFRYELQLKKILLLNEEPSKNNVNKQKFLSELNQIKTMEFKFQKAFLDKYQRNYHIWNYRRKLFQFIISQVDIKQKESFYLEEVTLIQQYCGKEVHQYCAFNYLIYLLKQTIQDLNYSVNYIEQFIYWGQELVESYRKMYNQSREGEIDFDKLESLNSFIKQIKKLSLQSTKQ